MKVFRALGWSGLLLGLLAACDASDGFRSGVQGGADSVVLDFAVAFVARPLTLDDNGAPRADAVLDPTAFRPGAQLILKDRASAAAREQVLTAGLFPEDADGQPALYDVKDLSVSPDGQKLLFAMRAPAQPELDDEDQPTWNIWEYHQGTGELRRIIRARLNAEQGHDVQPAYLPDGRIVFASTRQRRTRAILLDEQKSQYPGLDDRRNEPALLLHVMHSDGSNIEQISFNASHDLYPSVMQDGQLLYLRWDAIAPHNRLSLYTANPDGSNPQRYYGLHSQNTGTEDTAAVLVRPLELPDGRILALLKPRLTAALGGDLVAVDGQQFVEFGQTLWPGGSGVAQQSLSVGTVDTRPSEISRAGRFSSAYPLFDGSNRLLVSWSPCRLMNPETESNAPCSETLLANGAQPSAPLFGLWIYDPEQNTQLPVKIPQEGQMFTEAVTLSPRPTPHRIMSSRDPGLAAAQLAVMNIRSVYDINGEDSTPDGLAAMANPAVTPPHERPVRFIRIVKNVPIPPRAVLDFPNSAFGRSTAQSMRDIVGYVPVEPDGSALFTVPADIPIMLDLLDAQGRRIGRRHAYWLHMRPGEQRQCTGCHAPGSEAVHGRAEAEPTSIHPGSPGGGAFPNSLTFAPIQTPGEPGAGAAAIFPEFGETMAEYYARAHGARTPSVDLLFTDEWTDPERATPGDPIALRYLHIAARVSANPGDPNCAPRAALPSWRPPTACTATGSWNSLCRITINYTESIHPIWRADRRECDADGTLVINHTCTDCHTRGLADAPQVPAAQLDLTGGVSLNRNAFITSYAELMFERNQLELVEGNLVVRVEEVFSGNYETDLEGELILDELGNPIPIFDLRTFPVPPAMSTDGARASNRFFRPFGPAGSHRGYLSPDELKLIAEWLDIGGQYYNNPFDVPTN